MSASRQARIERQLERIAAVFDRNHGGVSRSRLATLADIPVESISARMTSLRKRATDYEHIPAVLEIGGEWIYGWAVTMDQHYSEVRKRLKLKLARLRVDKELLAKSVEEYPDEVAFQRNLRATRHEIETAEEAIEETARILRKLGRQDVPA